MNLRFKGVANCTQSSAVTGALAVSRLLAVNVRLNHSGGRNTAVLGMLGFSGLRAYEGSGL